MFSPDLFLEKWLQASIQNRKPLTKDELQLQLQQALGRVPQPVHSLKVETIETAECAGYTRQRVNFQSAEGLSVPVYILTPQSDQASYPSVLALHGHGYGSRELVGLDQFGNDIEGAPGIHQNFAVQLVKKGLKVFVPEVLGFGDRILSKDIGTEKGNSCFALSSALLMTDSTLAGVRTYEARRTLDLMQSFPDVQVEKIGLVGFSGGALIASLTSALDMRVFATMLSGFTNTYQQSILAMNHCLDNYIPSIFQLADLPDIIGLIAPRKLFIEAGVDDPIFPLGGVKEAVKQLKTIYQEQAASDHLAVDLFQGSHTIHGKKSLPWMAEVLETGDGLS